MAHNWAQTMPRIDLELMGPNQVGFGLQNQQKQCSTQASPNRLYNSQLVDLIEKNSEFLRKYSLKNKEFNKKNGAQFRVRMREI